MGIKNLLHNLNILSKRTSLMNFTGQSAAIDAYAWLHRGLYSSKAVEVLAGNSSSLVKYCLDRARLLRQRCNIEPVFVFDGANLPLKGETNSERGERRVEARKELSSFIQKRDFTSSAARQLFSAAIDITPNIASDLIKALRKHNIRYVVAPYEADAQLTYLCNNGFVDVVITEDQDLIPFGCSDILFKIDFTDFTGDYYSKSNLFENDNKSFNLTNFTFDMFQDACILSGCDYLKNIKGIGLLRAHNLILRRKTYIAAIEQLERQGKYDIPIDYKKGFTDAKYCFNYQRVFNGLIDYSPSQKLSMVTLNEKAGEVDDTLVGHLFDEDIMFKIASGMINPITLEEIPLFISNTEDITEKTKSQSSFSNFFENPLQRNYSTTPTFRRKYSTLSRWIQNKSDSPVQYSTISHRKRVRPEENIKLSSVPTNRKKLPNLQVDGEKTSSSLLFLPHSPKSSVEFKAPRKRRVFEATNKFIQTNSKTLFQKYEFKSDIHVKQAIKSETNQFQIKKINFKTATMNNTYFKKK